MDPKIKKALSIKEVKPWHDKILSHVKGLVEKSSKDMSQYYERWDLNRETYRSRRSMDAKDKRAAEAGEPVKMTLPLTFAQVETFVSYGVDLLLQRENLFELRGSNAEGHKTAHVAQAILQRDVQNNKPRLLLSQLLRDVALCDIGVVKPLWEETKEKRNVRVKVEEKKVLGVTVRAETHEYQSQEVTSFQGNKMTVVSPYRFFPDTRLPLTRFQEGEFCADEQHETLMSLKKLEAQGLVCGIDHVTTFKAGEMKTRASNRFDITDDQVDAGATRNSSGVKPTYVRTCVQVDIIPSKFFLDDEKSQVLGDGKEPERWIIEYANDARIIRMEPFYYPHGKFTYALAQYTADQHELLSESLADMVHYLQETATFLLNTHITSIRKVIDNRFVGVADALHLEDFQNGRPFIRVKAAYAGRDLRSIIQQLQVNDVTAGNVNEIGAIIGLIQQITGISPNLAGNFASGRRSAKEVGAVNQSALTRIRLVLGVFYEQLLVEAGEQMISNARDSLTEETYIRLVGDTPAEIEALDGYINVSRDDIGGNYEFEVFDGMSSSDREGRAYALQELIGMLAQTPEILATTGYNLDTLIRETLLLRGIRNPERFKAPTGAKDLPPEGDNREANAMAALEQQLMSGGLPQQTA